MRQRFETRVAPGLRTRPFHAAVLVFALVGSSCKPRAVATIEAERGDARAPVPSAAVQLVFASAEEGKRSLTLRDDFVGAMSPFDRAARLKTNRDVGEEEYLAFVGKNVTDWSPDEKAKVNDAAERLQPRLAAMGLPFPKTVTMIRTTGNEEGGAAYTRGTAIVLPPSELRQDVGALQGTLAHELFHVLSRSNPELKERAYLAIGFAKCNEIELPADTKARKITNPDAPKNDHRIQLKIAGEDVWVVPILLSSTARYDVARGGEFFEYLRFKWLVVDRTGVGAFAPLLKSGSAQWVDMKDVSGFYEQVGRNTEYTIHPEEILADNFKLLVTGGPMRSPDVSARISAALTEGTVAASSSSPNPRTH